MEVEGHNAFHRAVQTGYALLISWRSGAGVVGSSRRQVAGGKGREAGGMRQGAGASVQQVRLLLAFLMWLQYI